MARETENEVTLVALATFRVALARLSYANTVGRFRSRQALRLVLLSGDYIAMITNVWKG